MGTPFPIRIGKAPKPETVKITKVTYEAGWAETETSMRTQGLQQRNKHPAALNRDATSCGSGLWGDLGL